LDLTDPDSIEAGAEVLTELDVLIHNAGCLPGTRRRVDRRRMARHVRGERVGAVALTLHCYPHCAARAGT